MKKFLKAIQKNFRILFRVKASLLAMIFGPLLVIFLISMAFNSSAQFQISIGYTAQDNSTLTNDFVSSLKKEYSLTEFNSVDTCVWELQQSLQHVCIMFPEKFEVKPGQTNNVTFYVDQTRVNIVYAVLASVSEQIGIKSDQLSQGLTQNLIDTLDETSKDIDSNLGSLILIKKNIQSVQDEVKKGSNDLNSIDFNTKDINVDQSSKIDTIQDSANDIKRSAQNTVDDGLTLIQTIRPGITNTSKISKIDELETSLQDLNKSVNDDYNNTKKAIDNLEQALTAVQTQVTELQDQFQSAQKDVTSSANSLQSISTQLSTVLDDINVVKQSLELSSNRIGNIEITSSEQIVNPISTNIKTVSSDQNQLLVLFPYVLLLIVMFGGLMLSSTLIVLEKKSRAFFRVFTTPTRDQFYIWTSFFTNFSIVIAQLVVIYVLMKLFFIDLIGKQLLVNASVLVISTALFVMLGMAVGYLMRNQQGANILSISLGSIFLFLSNIVLPLETIAPFLQKVASYNPFVIASEVLRQSIVFQTPITDMYFELGILLAYIIIIFIMITVIHSLAKARFVQRLTKHSKHSIKQKGIRVKNKFITSEKELLHFVNSVSEKEFSKAIRTNKKLRKFIREEVSDAIGRRMKSLTKEGFLKAIEDKNKEIIAYLERKKPDSEDKNNSDK